MSFQLAWTPEAEAAFDELEDAAVKAKSSREKSGKTKKPKQEGLFGQVAKTISLLRENPRHPGLETHPHHSLPAPTGGKTFEAYVQNKTPGAYRLFFCYGPDENMITIIAITPHS